MKRVLVTGANGFVGSQLCNYLLTHGYNVTAAVQEVSPDIEKVIQQIVISDISSDTDWGHCIETIDVVVHLAARVHVMRETATDPLTAFRKVNVAGTKNLIEQAVAANVKRFIFVSSLHVNGTNSGDRPFQEIDLPHPQSSYAISKFEGEQIVQDVAVQTNLETVIVRPPLIYGPGVKANFLSLLKLIKLGLPLPLAAVTNRRSLLGRTNLLNFLSVCIEHPRAANELFLVADDEDISVADLLRKMAVFYGRKPRLFPLPSWLLYSLGRMVGKLDAVDRLCGSLRANINKARELLKWHSPQSFDQGLKEVVIWFKQEYL